MTEETLFELAVNTPESDRAALLDRECAGDPALRARVEALLRADGRTLEFAPPATHTFNSDGTRSLAGRETIGEAGQVVAGRYTLVEVIGEGGMGSVWRAKQTEPVKRFVAVKLIKAGMDSKAVLARFDAERQALALMDHPNIAKILDGGVHENRPYFVMELVKGTPITEFCDARKLTPQQRLELFVPVCNAIQHAHQKGIIHRDIKPSNVLIALYDDKPVPKVIDFGVAKATGAALTEQTIDTGFGGVVGTPQYMSPEQATFNNLDIDTRTDVYALGVLLYELLAGSPPFSNAELKKKGLMEILRVVREEEPPRPSTKLSTADALPTLSANRGTEPKKLTGLLRNELDWIVMKALEKDRARRYESANGFAADVQRYLSGEQVQAVPPSLGYRLKKAYRRNRAAVWVTAAFTLLMATGVIVSSLLAVRAKNAEVVANENAEQANANAEQARDAERKEAEQRELAQKKAEEADRERQAALLARDDARRTHYAAQMNLAQNAFNANDGPACLRLLDELRPKTGEPDLRGIEWHGMYRSMHTHELELALPNLLYATQSAKFSADCKRLFYPVAVPASDPKQPPTYKIVVRELPGGALLKELPVPPKKMQPDPNDWPPRGIAAGGGWRPGAGSGLAIPVNDVNFRFFLDVSDDGKVIAIGEENRCLIYETDTEKLLYSQEKEVQGGFRGRSGVDLSGNGKWAMFIQQASRDRMAEPKPAMRIVIDLVEGKEVVRKAWPRNGIRPTLNYDGKLMTYSTGEEGEAVIADTLTEEVKARFPKLATEVMYGPGTLASATLNRDGTRLRHIYAAFAENDLRVRQGGSTLTEIWDVPNKKRLVGNARDVGVPIGFSYTGEPVLVWDRRSELGNSVSGAIRVLEPESRRLIATIRPPVPLVSVVADIEGRVYGVSANGKVYVWKVTPLPSEETDPRHVPSSTSKVKFDHTCLAASNAGDRFAYLSSNLVKPDKPQESETWLTLVNGERGPLLKRKAVADDQILTFKFRPLNVAFDPTGTTLYGVQYEASNLRDPNTMRSRLWRWDTTANKLEAFGDTWPTAAVSTSHTDTRFEYRQMILSLDGSRIAAVTSRPKDKTHEFAVIILDTKTGRTLHTTGFVEGELHSLEFATDRRTVTAQGEDRTAGWMSHVSFDTETGQVVSNVRFPGVIQKKAPAMTERAGDIFAFAVRDDSMVPPGSDVGPFANVLRPTSVLVHHAKTGARLVQFSEPGKLVNGIALSPNGNTLAVSFSTTQPSALRSINDFGNPVRTAKLYSLPDGRELGTVDGGMGTLQLLFSPDGMRMIVFSTVGSPTEQMQQFINIHDSRTGRLLTRTAYDLFGAKPQWSRDGTKLVFGTNPLPGASRFGFSKAHILDFSPLPEAK